MTWFWIGLLVFAFILVQGIFEVGGPIFFRWLFDRAFLLVSLTYTYLRTRRSASHAQSVSECQQVKSAHVGKWEARKLEERQAELKAAEWRKQHPVVFALFVFTCLGLPFFVSFGMLKWDQHVQRQKGECRSMLNRLADEYLEMIEKGDVPSSGMLENRDVWGEPVQLTCMEQNKKWMVTVSSSGRDRKFHTFDDMSEMRIQTATTTDVVRGVLGWGAGVLKEKAKQKLEKMKPE